MIRQRDAFNLTTAALWLTAPPIIIFAIGDWLFGVVRWRVFAPVPLLTDPILAHYEAAGRTYVLAALFGVIGVGLLVMSLAAADLVRLFGQDVRSKLLWVMVIVAASTLGWFGATSNGATEDLMGDCVIAAFLDNTASISGQWACEAQAKATGFTSEACDVARNVRVCPSADSPLLSQFRAMIEVARYVIVGGAAASIAGTISCLATPLRSEPGWARDALFDLQRRRFRRYLNAAALFLVVSLMFLIAVLRWPAAAYLGVASQKPALDAYLAHADAMSAYFGLYYSLIIASYVLPVSAILRHRMTRPLLGPDTVQGQVGLAPADGFFDIVSYETLTKILAVAAPALVGLLSPILDLLGRGA
jgi:hypothetical protein